jgi:hypothetical protein
LEDVRHSSVLYVCKYFVLYILSPCLCLEQEIIPPLEAGVLLLQLTVSAQLLLHHRYEYMLYDLYLNACK